MPGEVTRPVRAARKGCATAPSLRSLRSTNARTTLSIASAVHGSTFDRSGSNSAMIAQAWGPSSGLAFDAERAVALERLGPVGPMDERNMRNRGHLPAERVVDLGLPRSVGEMVVAPDDVGHAHIVIVDHHRQHVCRRAVGTQEHEIVEVLVLPNDSALHLIFNRGLAGKRRPQADHRLDPGRGLGGGAITPTPVTELGAAFASRPLPHLVQPPLGGGA